MVYSNQKSNGVLEVPAGDHGFKQDNNDTTKEEKSWEHPWTTNEIRKNSSNWTLAGDVGLLNHLKQFSHTLISRTHGMEKVVDDLVHKSKVACVKVNNVINDFQMLSNLQFVENRVYDEEAKEAEPVQIQDQPKTKEQREAEMVPRIVQALELGISVLDKAFERIEVEETSESEDEEDISQGRTILEPKDFYEHRPLPFIIGSQEFQNDDHAGLHNLYEEDISTDISTQDENISASAESEDESEESDYEPAPPPQPTVITEHKDTKSSVDTLQNNYSESEGSDLFDAEEEEEEKVNDYLPVKTSVEKPKLDAKTSLMEELKKKTAPPTTVESNSKPESIQSAIRTEIIDKKESDDLFASGDSFMENEDSPFRKKTGLFSAGGGGLFDSQEEEKLSSSLFDDDEIPPVITKEVPKRQEQKVAPQKKQETLAPKSVEPSNFFDDDDDSEHDLFASISTSAPSSNAKTSTKVTKNTSVSATSTPIQSTKDKKPVGLLEQTTSSNSLFGDDSDENDLFSSVNKGSRKTSSFDSIAKEEDDDEDDLFSIRPSKSGKTDSKILDSDMVTQTPQKNKLPSLFEDSESFDLFKPNVGETQPKMDVVNSRQPTKSNDVKTKGAKSSLLFEEDESFSDSNPVIKTSEPKDKAIKASSLFEESDSFFNPDPHKKPPEVKVSETKASSLFEDSDSFIDSKQEVKPVLNKTEEVRTSSSLFEESDSDSKLPVKPSKPKIKETKPSSLFEESDSFDLFAPKKDAKKEEPLAAKVSSVPQTQYQETDSSSGFDQPISGGTTLSAINKDRVKIQAKRRKPTRKGRQMNMSHNAELEQTDESKATNTGSLFTQPESQSDLFSSHEQLLKGTDSIAESSSTRTSPIKVQNTYKRNEQSKKNLMSQLISEAAVSKIGKRSSAVDDDDDDEDGAVTDKDSSSKSVSSDFSLVSPTSVKPSDFAIRITGKTEITERHETNDVLSDSTSDDDLFSARPFSDFNSSTANKNSVFDDDDDDIFKPLKNEDAKSQISGMSITDADDDIFAGVDKEKYEMFPTQSFDDDDDDDIFSNIGKPSKPVSEKLSTKNTKDKAKENTDIFNDPLGGLALND